MQLEALQKVTLIDYPGKVAATVFTIGCNFNCCFCHNPGLVNCAKSKKQTVISHEFLLNFLRERNGLLDGLCISGGEPTIQPDLADFVKQIKEIGLLVKLDTNGNNPSVLKELFNRNLLDYVAMDIKSPSKKYSKIVNCRVNLNNINQSINLIKNSGIDYEFRTTAVPKIIDEADIKKIGEWLYGAKAYFLQQFRKENALDKKWRTVMPYSDEKLKELGEIAKPYFEKVGIRGI